jgi:xanthine/uracil permease
LPGVVEARLESGITAGGITALVLNLVLRERE